MHFYQRIAIAIVLLLGSVLCGQPRSAHSQVGDAVLFVNPPTTQVDIGDEFEVRISVRDVVDLYAYELNINFPTDKLEVVNFENVGFLSGDEVNLLNNDYNETGLLTLYFTQVNPTLPASGSGDLLIITFKTKPGLMAGSAAIQIHSDSVLSDRNGIAIQYSTEAGLVYYDFPHKTFLPLIQK